MSSKKNDNENLVEVGVSFSYWGLENIVSGNFNRFKAKLYNLIEASISDKQQVEALKGLIKGFANDEYRNAIENMRYHAEMAGWIEDRNAQNVAPLSAQPLEKI